MSNKDFVPFEEPPQKKQGKDPFHQPSKPLPDGVRPSREQWLTYPEYGVRPSREQWRTFPESEVRPSREQWGSFDPRDTPPAKRYAPNERVPWELGIAGSGGYMDTHSGTAPKAKPETAGKDSTMKSPAKAQAPTGPLFPVKADVKVASARVQGHGAMPESQEQQLHHKFETDVAAKAQGLLKANKDHLNSEQTQYAQDKNPKSDRWSNLWQAEGKRRGYETQEYQMVDERMRVVEESNGLSTALDPLYDTPADQARKKQRAAYLESRQAFLNSQIEYTRQMQVSLSYAYPALAAIKGETGANSGDMQRVQARLPQAFNEIRGDIDRIGQWLADDPSKAWLFDSVVVSQLKDKSLSAQQRGQLIAEVERQRQSAAGGLMLGLMLSGSLFVASFIPGLQDFAIPLRVAGLGMGGAVAASEIPDLMLLDLAAQSGRGGAGALTNQSPEQARFNLVMGYANVGLAGLDVGLEVGAVQKLAGVTGKLATAGVQVSRQQWSQVMGWVKQGPAGVEKAKAFLASIKGMSKGKAAEAIQLIKNGFSPEVETVGVPGQSAVKTTDENIRDAKALQAKTKGGGSGESKQPPKSQAHSTPELPEFKDIKLGKELGSGGNKIAYEVPGREDIAIAILEKGKPTDAINKEIRLLNELKEQGLPTVEVLGTTGASHLCDE